MANEVVVGVKRIKTPDSILAELDEEASVAIGAMWVTIDGKEVGDGTKNMISIALVAGPDQLDLRATASDTEGEGGILQVTMQFFCSSFKTVDFRDPVYAPARFRSQQPEVQRNMRGTDLIDPDYPYVVKRDKTYVFSVRGDAEHFAQTGELPEQLGVYQTQ